MLICPATAVSTDYLEYGSSGGFDIVHVTAKCTGYTVAKNVNWISYTKDGYDVDIEVSMNFGSARSGNITIGGFSISVHQACGNYPSNAGNITGANSICAGQTNVNYQVSSISGATSYSWTLPYGATIVSGDNTNSILVNFSNNAISGDIYVAGTNSCGYGITSPRLFVTVSQKPNAVAGGNYSICAGQTINLTSSGGSGYFWIGPNGFTSTSQYPSIPAATILYNGTYNVTVSNSAGCTSSASTQVSVFSNPVVTISSNSPVCSGNTIILNSSGGTNFFWTGPNFTSEVQNPLIPLSTTAMSGIYTVTAIDIKGCSASASLNVNVNSLPIPAIIGNQEVCPYCYDVKYSTDPGRSDYSWTIIGGTGVSNTNNINVNWGASGIGHVKVNYKDANGCMAINPIDFPVNIKPLPIITNQPQNLSVPPDNQAIFNVTALGENLQYQWQSAIYESGPWTDLQTPVNGFNSSSLTIGKCTDSKYYRCRITSNQCSAFSNAAKLTVEFPLIDYLGENEVPNIENRKLNKSLNVGSTSGNYSISGLGNMIYNIPLFIPQGTNGMQPSLHLIYNSFSKDGLLGSGWDLGGLSSISRIENPYYNGNNPKSVDMVTTDEYAIDGNRLVLNSGTQGTDGSTYSTEYETFMDITAKGSSGNGPQWFEVKLKNGTIIQYGNGQNSNSNVTSSNGTIMIWNITKVTDIFGNYCEYIYRKDYNTSQQYLYKIRYTGNANKPLQPYNEIIFSYSKKRDSNELYYPGLVIPKKLLVTEINCVADSMVLRTYKLGYTYNNCSHLTTLVESGINGHQLNSTIFKWGGSAQSYKTIPIDTILNESNGIYRPGDFNGDGRVDFIIFPKRHRIFYDTLDIWRIYLAGENSYSLITQGNLDSSFEDIIIADGDNDGDDDVYFKSNVLESSSFKYYYLENNILNRNSIYDLLSPETRYSDMLSADFDGNGMDDFVFLYRSKNIMNFANIDVQNIPDLNFPDNLILLDFNGNGKTDIATLKRDTLTGNDSLKIIEYNSSTKDFGSILNSYWLPKIDDISTGDFNGDGKTDFLIRRDSNDSLKTEILYSTGNGIIKHESQVSENLVYVAPLDSFIYRDVVKNIDLIVSDFNLDGRDDILKSVSVFSRNYINSDLYRDTTTIEEYIYLSNGLDFVKEQVYNGEGHQYFGQLDRNHDGRTDLTISTDDAGDRTIEFLPSDFRNYLSAVVDGMNRKYEFTYKGIKDTAVYSREIESYTTPVRPLTYPLNVLSGVKTYDNNHNSLIEEVNYRYTNLKTHVGGKGNLGFSKIVTNNLTTGRKSISQYGYDTLYYCTYLKNSEDFINGHLVARNTNSQSIIPFDNGTRYLPYNSLVTQSDILNNISVTDSLSLDPIGNIHHKVTSYTEGDQSIVKQIRQEFNGYNSFGLPTSRVITNIRSNDTITRTKSLTYITDKPLIETEVASFGSSPSLSTSYTYDDFGNLSSETKTSSNKSRTVKNIFDPQNGRFLIRKVNELNDTIKYTYNSSGNLGKIEDISGLVTTNTYDDFGNLKHTTYSDGRSIDKYLEWSQDSVDINELYLIRTTISGKPTSIDSYDIQNRKFKSKIQGFDGTYLVNKNEFDTKGRVVKTYNPYFEGSSADQYTIYGYDEYDRLLTKTLYPDNTSVTYSYNPNEVTETKAGQQYRKKTDAAGLLIESTDPGGTISYTYNAENNLKSVNSPSGVTSIEYDDYGYQKSLQDIDAGKILYEYDAFGEIKTQTDAKNIQQTYLYDNAGRIESITWNGGESISYEYYTKNRQLRSITASNGTRQRYEYDEFSRLRTRIDSINTSNRYIAAYSYDSTGVIDNIVMNNSVTIDYNYNTFGYLDQVYTNNQLIWDANSMNKFGVIDNFTLGNQTSTSISFDSYGYLDRILTTKNGSYLQNWDYDFNHVTGNLSSRSGLSSTGNQIQENFTYDGLNRLLTYSIGGNIDSVSYDQINIISKKDVGVYNYTNGKHNVASITNPTSMMQNQSFQEIEYNSFNKVSYIKDSSEVRGLRELYLTYGPDQQRIKTEYKVENVLNKTKYFALGNYEKEIDSLGNTRELYYISGNDGTMAILQRKGNQDSIFYVHKDYLGSFDVISNQDGSVRERYNFDPWGRRRNPIDWFYNVDSLSFNFDRGFTGHEHLDQFNLINMNGRVYDPLAAVFLSPDPFINSYDFTQDFNRYTYCLNNPLIYSDPSGLTYFKLVDNDWVSFEYTSPFMGGNIDFRTASGGGVCLKGPSYEEIRQNNGDVYVEDEYGRGTWITSSEINPETKDKNKPSLDDLKNNPPDHPEYKAPKSGDRKVRNPNGRGIGWIDRNGRVWVPDDHNGTHAPHWDRQEPKGGGYTPVYPYVQPAMDPSLRDRIGEAVGLSGAALTIYLIISEGSRLFPPRNLIPVP